MQACNLLGYSPQAYYKPQALKRELVGLEVSLKQAVAQERLQCPGIGCRLIYQKHSSHLPVGRDKAVAIMRDLNLMVRPKRKYVRTTEAGLRIFDNLLVERQLSGINEVWQSDMTYYQSGKKTYYLIFITDVYSQRILGYEAYERAFGENFAAVLHQAILLRKKQGELYCWALILHSDGGKQYEAACFRALCLTYHIRQSMCIYSWENPYAEKTNDLIKNRYLQHWKPDNLTKLRQCLKNAVEDHNKNQPKSALGGLSPVDFEKTLSNDQFPKTSYTLKLKPSNPTVRINRLNLSNNKDPNVTT